MQNKVIAGPDRKVSVGAFVSSLVAFALWVFTSGTGIAVPGEIAVSLNTAFIFGVQYFVKNKD